MKRIAKNPFQSLRHVLCACAFSAAFFGPTAHAQDAIVVPLDGLAMADAQNGVFGAQVTSEIIDQTLQIQVFLAGRSYDFYRRISFELDANEGRPPEARDNPDVAAYFLDRNILRVGAKWETAPTTFYDVKIVTDDAGFPTDIRVLLDQNVTHDPDVIAALGDYVVTQTVAEGMSQVQLIDANTGDPLLETSGFFHEIFPNGPVFRSEGGEVTVETACSIDGTTRAAETIFDQIFKCDCPEDVEPCKRPNTYVFQP